MELTAYVMDGHSLEIRPAPVERQWMEDTRERYAYRCLPLNIANTYGWEVLLPGGFRAGWDGNPELAGIQVIANEGEPNYAVSHFGFGILTITIPALFRTEPGYDLMVTGPINVAKDSITALTGIIETDWAPYTFTMNWRFTRPGAMIEFKKGEPFCHIMPIKHAELEEFDPKLKLLSENPELERQHKAWEASRTNFLKDLKEEGNAAGDEKWQKFYYVGVDADGNKVKSADHRTRVRLKPFKT